MQLRPVTAWYNEWFKKVDSKLLCIQNSRGEYLLDKANERNLKHLNFTCIDKIWFPQLLLITLIETDRKKDIGTIRVQIATLNNRFSDIFNEFKITSWSNFNVNTHMYMYLKGEIYPDHTNNQRRRLLVYYNTCLYNTKKWVNTTLLLDKQTDYNQFLLPSIEFDSRDFSFTKLAMEQAQNTRKDETDAIVPHLSAIRAEANLRWNQMKRLRDAFHQQIRVIETDSISLPIEFSYAEPKRIGEVFHFRLWDKPSFVLNHQKDFSDIIIKQAAKKKSTYSDENNAYFLEFIRAESIESDSIPEGLWFNELIEQNVLGLWSKNRSIEEPEKILKFLSLWGYESENEQKPSPFFLHHKGIITPSTFITLHKDKAEGLLIDVEPFYAACTFGLLAIDILTTTGARKNELLQISYTKECIQVKKINNKLHYSYKAIPKGRDSLEEFYLSKQTMEHIQTVSRMLKAHYGGDKIPSVLYRDERKHLFPIPLPYYFQYAGKALCRCALYSSIRFLLHGLLFEMQNGKAVTVKTHLLRHAFATEAVQRQKMPIDIVAKMLHQKDLNVTEYYSAPTPTQIAESVSELHDVISSYVDIDDVYLRSPQELQKEFDAHAEKVGVFNKVLGGTCVTDYVCPTKMQCLGCKAKIPEPDQEDELLEVIQLSKDMERRFKQLGLEVEVRKAKEMAKQAKNELKEIDLIKQYREERSYEPITKRNPFR
ncbi:integrase [Lysinibacillus sphaericus]|nr:tyrosine-type recombinase/integrase [Lysinibacillus sphaericus]MBG9455338.1 integrase [Lysinibacillus sphaericus]MBG9476148.1 integrase [Lysinibacillus sphaericus]MBG9592599.1 integrase [Lysinibacillus sphaericus]